MIDWERIEDLRREVGQKDFADVVRLFLKKLTAVYQKYLSLQSRMRSAICYISFAAVRSIWGFLNWLGCVSPIFLRWKRAYLPKKFGPISNVCSALMNGPRRSFFRIPHYRFKFK